MIFAFLIDSSLSMNRKFTDKFTYFEAAIAAVDKFLHHESRKPKPPATFILQCYDSQSQILTSKQLLFDLKQKVAVGTSDAGKSFANLFELLNLYRISQGSVCGKGWCPGNEESCLIFWITDSTLYTNFDKVFDNLQIPGLKTLGAEGHIEPFRWEQRLYTIVMDGKNEIRPPSNLMTDSVGGHCWHVQNLQELLIVIDNCQGVGKHLTSKTLGSPVCHIEGCTILCDSLPKNLVEFPKERVFLYANSSTSKSFMIPENYYPQNYYKDGRFTKLPRNAHPVVSVSNKDEVYHLFDGFPVDRFSMEKCSFSEQLLKRPRGTCWAVTIIDIVVCQE